MLLGAPSGGRHMHPAFAAFFNLEARDRKMVIWGKPADLEGLAAMVAFKDFLPHGPGCTVQYSRYLCESQKGFGNNGSPYPNCLSVFATGMRREI